MENVYIKDSIDISNIQIISARSGKIIENGPNKILYSSFGEIVDITDIITKTREWIKFNSTTINLSNVKTKSTTHPKLQEPDSKVLIDCVKNFMIGTKINYSLPFFVCDKIFFNQEYSRNFKRSLKQFYIILLGTVASLLIFSNNQNKKLFI